jgi:hypothetical protein
MTFAFAIGHDWLSPINAIISQAQRSVGSPGALRLRPRLLPGPAAPYSAEPSPLLRHQLTSAVHFGRARRTLRPSFLAYGAARAQQALALRQALELGLHAFEQRLAHDGSVKAQARRTAAVRWTRLGHPPTASRLGARRDPDNPSARPIQGGLCATARCLQPLAVAFAFPAPSHDPQPPAIDPKGQRRDQQQSCCCCKPQPPHAAVGICSNLSCRSDARFERIAHSFRCVTHRVFVQVCESATQRIRWKFVSRTILKRTRT